jgi:2-dehydropantoate 2-reductase
MSRYIIYGAGSVGGIMGASLKLSGHDVVLIARGANLDAIKSSGLRLRTPNRNEVVKLEAYGTMSEATIKSGDRIVLGMKTQEVAQALQEVANKAPRDVSIICAQNGLESERMALRLFDNVYGTYVFVYAALTAPGVAGAYSDKAMGILDVGRYPNGTDAGAETIAAELRGAGFDSVARPDVMKWKRGKLLINMANPIGALCSAPADLADVVKAAQEEAEACFRAAGMDFVTPADVHGRAKDLPHAKIDGMPFPGGSTQQGLARGLTTSEVDYLNGEIVLLGRIHGVPTPVNGGLQRMMRDVLRNRAAPGSLSPDDVRQRLKALA